MNRHFKALAIFSALTAATQLLLFAQGCSSSNSNPPPRRDAGPDSGPPKPDSGPPKPDAGPKDAGPKDAGDAGKDAGKDGGRHLRAGQTAMAFASEAQENDKRSFVPEAACDGDGEAWCSGDGRVTVCVQNRQYELECASTGAGNACSEDFDEDIADCTFVEN